MCMTTLQLLWLLILTSCVKRNLVMWDCITNIEVVTCTKPCYTKLGSWFACMKMKYFCMYIHAWCKNHMCTNFCEMIIMHYVMYLHVLLCGVINLWLICILYIFDTIHKLLCVCYKCLLYSCNRKLTHTFTYVHR